MSTSTTSLRNDKSIDKVNLKMILATGHTTEFPFEPRCSANHITTHVFNNWPSDWPVENKPQQNILRLIYQGRFLHGDVTLTALQLPTGRTTVMHLVPRETLPEKPNEDKPKKDKSGAGNDSSNCCTIL